MSSCHYTNTVQAAMTHIVRMGATRSREAMRIPSSAMRAVSSSAQVGSPLAFPWPNTWRGGKSENRIGCSFFYIHLASCSENRRLRCWLWGRGWCCPWRWPAGAEERRSETGGPRRTLKRKSRSRWPRVWATPGCPPPGSLWRSLQTCRR